MGLRPDQGRAIPFRVPNLPVWEALRAAGLDVYKRGRIDMRGTVIVNGIELMPAMMQKLQELCESAQPVRPAKKNKHQETEIVECNHGEVHDPQ